MNFEQILADIESVVPVKRDLDHTLDVEFGKNSGASHTYRVVVPVQYRDGIDEGELITRCDNRGDALDLRNPAGQRCHFGGDVKWIGERLADVTVWVD